MNPVEKILEAYSNDLEGLTLEECREAGFSRQQCDSLVGTLGWGKQGEITVMEKQQLEKAHFSKQFIDELAGNDGLKALQNRVRWLADHINTRWLRKDFSVPERREMVFELRYMGDLAYEAELALLDAAFDEDKYVQWSAGRAHHLLFPFSNKERGVIEEADPTGATEKEVFALLDILVNGNPSQWERTLQKVKDLGERVTPILTEAFRIQDLDMQHAVLFALERLGKDAKAAFLLCRDILRILHGQKNSYLRVLAIKVLEKMEAPPEKILPILLAAFFIIDDASNEARRMLIAIGEKSVPFLIQSMARGSYNWTSGDMLVEIGSTAIEPFLSRHFRHNFDWDYITLWDNDYNNIVTFIRDIGAPKAVHKLIEMLNSPNAWFEKVRRGLIQPPAYFNYDLPASAAYALGVLGKEAAEAVPHLIGVLKSEALILRLFAAAALGKIGPDAFPAVPELKRMAQGDPSPNCRKAAKTAIEKLMGEIR